MEGKFFKAYAFYIKAWEQLLFTKFFKKILPSRTTGLIPTTQSYTSLQEENNK